MPAIISDVGPCHSDEYIQINGTCLYDDDNPSGNLFNSTVNTQASNDDSPPCGVSPAHTCCSGDGLCGIGGVDIDTFDASQPDGTQEVSIAVGTGMDRVAIGLVVASIGTTDNHFQNEGGAADGEDGGSSQDGGGDGDSYFPDEGEGSTHSDKGITTNSSSGCACGTRGPPHWVWLCLGGVVLFRKRRC